MGKWKLKARELSSLLPPQPLPALVWVAPDRDLVASRYSFLVKKHLLPWSLLEGSLHLVLNSHRNGQFLRSHPHVVQPLVL